MIIGKEKPKRKKLEAEVNKYDMQCKEVMRDINLVAYVCKEGIQWCKNLSIEEIKKCLAAAHPCRKESSKVVLYKLYSDDIAIDICTLIFNPLRKGFEIVIIEIQNKIHAKYSGDARLISCIGDAIVLQKGVAYEGEDYESLWPVNAIMIFKNPPKDLENEVIMYPEKDTNKEDLGYDFSIWPVLTFLHLGNEEKTDNASVRLLDIVYKGTDAAKIRKQVKEHYGFELTKGGIERMCDLGMGIVEETRQQDNVQAIVNVMEELKLSIERTMEILKIPEEEKPLYLQLINEALGA